MSVDEMCQVIEDEVKSPDLAAQLIGIVRAGHNCRIALGSLCPESPQALKLLNQYDKFWLGFAE